MRILFVTAECGVEPLGIGYLSAALKAKGHQTDFHLFKNLREFYRNLYEFAPNVVGLSTTTGLHIKIIPLASVIKGFNKDITVIAGGSHPTYFSGIEKDNNIDYIVKGEADFTLPKLISDLDKGIVIKKKIYGELVLPENLDDLPFPDRDVFYKYDVFNKNKMRNILTSRGCPFSCSYCFSENAVVQTHRGFLKIRDVQIGDFVITKNKSFNQVTQLHQKFYNGEMFSIKAIGIPKIEVTPDHKFLISNGKTKRADELTIGDKLMLNVPKIETNNILYVNDFVNEKLIYIHKNNSANHINVEKIKQLLNSGKSDRNISIQTKYKRSTIARIRKNLFNKSKILHSFIQIKDEKIGYTSSKILINNVIIPDREFGMLIGLYLAEGSINSTKSRQNYMSVCWCFGKHETQLIEFVSNSLKRIFGITIRIIKQKNTIRIYCGASILSQFLLEFCGEKSHEKNIKKWMFEYGIEFAKGVIDGYLMGDGCQNRPNCWRANSVSYGLAHGMVTLARAVGYRASMFNDNKKNLNRLILGRKTKNRIVYGFTITKSEIKNGNEKIYGTINEIKVFHVNNFPVYNLGIDEISHTYQVNGVIVHNCYANIYKEMYKGQKIVRYRSPENIIEECCSVMLKYDTKMFFFADDEFSMNIERLRKLKDLYVKNVKLPFHCQIRIDLLNEERIKLLKGMGCYSLTFAIEIGNEDIRKQLLNRNISNQQIIDGGNKLRKYGIKFRVENMIGLPNETLKERFETLNLNIKVKPNYAWVSIFQPFPNTALGEICRKNNFLKGDIDDIKERFSEASILNFSDKQQKELIVLQRVFSIFVSFPILKLLFGVFVKVNNVKLYTKLRDKWKRFCYKQIFKGI